MSITQIRQSVTELLSAIDIAESDILNDLEDLQLTQVFHTPIQLEAALLDKALSEQIKRVEKFETIYASFNQNLLQPTRMKHGWRPREPLVPKMMAVFEKTRLEIGNLRENFIENCLTTKNIWSRSWNEEFLRFALKNWWADFFLSNTKFKPASNSAQSKTIDNVTTADVAIILRELSNQFTSWKKRLRSSWQPSLGAARRLEQLGVPRDVTYHPLFVNGFINNVNAGKFPFKDFDFNYIHYVIESRKQIERIESESAAKRQSKKI